MCHDAVEVLHKMIPDNSLRSGAALFPYPWREKRAMMKRRIVQVPFAELVKSKLQLGCIPYGDRLEPYAEHMLEVMLLLTVIKTCQRAMITYRVRHHVR